MDAGTAAIERGIVVSAPEGGYKVQSYSRDGLITPVLPSLTQDAYTQGDKVYFFLFDDGHGAILGKIV
jgi:hypothetical protein